MTFLAALRCDRVDAPCIIDGPINGCSFLAYVEQILAPTLQPGDVVIIDNLASHKSRAVEKAIRATGARLLFLPPYSPDLNPIEQVFAKTQNAPAKGKHPLGSKPLGGRSEHSSTASRRPSAPTTSQMPDMLQYECITL